MSLDDRGVRHGTYKQYGRGCRCAECTAASTEAHRRYNARKLATLKPDSLYHGTVQGYNIGCRCDRCHAAINRHSRNRRATKAGS